MTLNLQSAAKSPLSPSQNLIPPASGADDLVSQCQTADYIEHIGCLADGAFFQKLIIIEAGAADENGHPGGFQRLEAVERLAGTGCKADAAVEQDNAPEGVSQFRQGGKKVVHELGAEDIIAAPEGFRGDEHESLSAWRDGVGMRLGCGFGSAAAVTGSAYLPECLLLAFTGDGIAAGAQKTADILHGGQIIHKNAQGGRRFLLDHAAAGNNGAGAGKAAAIYFFHGHVVSS